MTDEAVMEAIFELSPDVRYVAIGRGQTVATRQREDLARSSAAESDRFEELLVNPTILLLSRQRGEIDCGGLRFVLVRYGNFFQLVMPLNDGHISVALEPRSDPLQLARGVAEIIS